MKPDRDANRLRQSELAQIHVAKKQLAMEDDAYRAMLWAVARVKSAADLDWTGRKRVLDHMARCGWKKKSARAPAGGPNARQIAKVRAVLIALGRLPDRYADAIAERMFKVKRFVWLDAQQLRGLIAALEAEKARQEKKEAGDA